MAEPYRGTSASRGYGYKWQQAREAYLAKHPLCVMCQAEGRTVAATVVDHSVPHRGDMTIFWDKTKWQSLCKPHHDRDKQAMEKGGVAVQGRGVDRSGRPTSGSHPWNRRA